MLPWIITVAIQRCAMEPSHKFQGWDLEHHLDNKGVISRIEAATPGEERQSLMVGSKSPGEWMKTVDPDLSAQSEALIQDMTGEVSMRWANGASRTTVQGPHEVGRCGEVYLHGRCHSRTAV